MTEACTAARFRQFLTSIDSVLFSKNEQGVDFPPDTKRKLFANERPRGRSPHGLWRHCPLKSSEDSFCPGARVPYDTAAPLGPCKGREGTNEEHWASRQE